MVYKDDSQLISQATTGSADAFTELVRRYRNMVYGYCYHRTGSFEDARDLAQETFVRAYTSLGQLRDTSKFPAWLRRIAANLCGRWYERKHEIPVDDIELPEPPHESHKAEIIHEALACLPENERLAVVMHYVDGLSYGEIAGFLEISKDAVRGRLHRGREALKSEVLKMTKEAFDENRLNEDFVIDSVRKALQESTDAYNIEGNTSLAWDKVNEAITLLDKVDCYDPENPVAIADALKFLAMREACHSKYDQALDHLERAKALYEKAGDEDGLTRWRWAVADIHMFMGNLKSAHELFSQILTYRLAQNDINKFDETLGITKAAILAIESFGIDTDWNRMVHFMLETGVFKREQNQTLFCYGNHQTGISGDNFPSRLNTVPAPPRDVNEFPLVLIRDEPQVGDTLRFQHKFGHSEESILESLSDTVTTPAGILKNCARSSNRIFASSDWSGDVIATRTLWIAPGVGLIKLAYQIAGKPIDTTELFDYHIESPSSDWIPLAVGNWWKYRWIEGEEQYNLRTEFYKGIVAQSDAQFAAVHYTYFKKT